jgi:hypothetical protein
MLSILNNFKLDYLIIGGVAVNIHGHLRYTKDLDIFVDESKTEDLLNVWIEFFGTDFDCTAKDLYKQNAWIFGNAPNRIDFLIRTKGVNFKECFNNKLTTHYNDIAFYVISKADLIKNKLAVGREQDLYDAKKLSLIK